MTILCRSALKDIQDRFREEGKIHDDSLSCVLVQHSTHYKGDRDDPPCINRYEQRLITRTTVVYPSPIARPDPHTKSPLPNPSKQEQSNVRSLLWIGRSDSRECYSSLAQNAGKILAVMPPDILLPLLPSDTLKTFGDDLLWVYSLFDLGWNKVPSSPLAIDQMVWADDGMECKSEDLITMQASAQHDPTGLMAPLLEIPNPPNRFFSKIDKPFTSSMYAIDILLSKLNAALDQAPDDSRRDAPTHSDDFTSVDWFGTKYTFSKGQQAESVKVLWEAWETGGHSLSEMTIGEKIASSSDRFRLAHVFRIKGGKVQGTHTAWGTMIQSVEKGIFALRAPNHQ